MPVRITHCRARGLLGAAVFACASAASTATYAQGIDVRTWRPSTDPNASLVVQPAVTPGPGVLSLGAYASYAYRPLTLRRAGTDDVAFRPVEHAFGFDAVANLGIGERLALGATLPVMLYQSGSQGLPPTVSSSGKVPATALGDVGLTVKGAFVRNEGGGFGLTGLGHVTFPTGNRESFASETGITAGVRLLAEYTLLIAVAQASLGYTTRTIHQTWPAPEAGGYRFGEEIPWTVGLAVRPGFLGVDPGNRQRWEVAAHGSLPAGPVGPFGAGEPGSAALSPVMLAVSDRVEVGHYRDGYVLAGADFGLNQAVGGPAIRGTGSVGWAFRNHDMDHDGVNDDVDGCPEIPEDRDGFEDSDGCPDVDNDDDGILDKFDACPNVKGAPSPDPKKNGCPLPDADGDGVEDAVDACPNVKGAPSKDPKKNGCPLPDADGDGIDDAHDKCPNEPEDKDGFQDDDGCPDPDNDQDGIPDREDACPNERGVPAADPARRGCPSLDRDGDTFNDDVDKCPDAPETWNGVADDDGCPDEGGKALVTIDPKRDVRLATAIKFEGKFEGSAESPEIAAASIPTVRALATELNRHPDWALAVGARPAVGDPTRAQLDALARSFAVVRVLATFAQRDGAAETVGWDAVRSRPQAESGLAFLVLVTPSQDTTGKAPGVPGKDRTP